MCFSLPIFGHNSDTSRGSRQGYRSREPTGGPKSPDSPNPVWAMSPPRVRWENSVIGTLAVCVSVCPARADAEPPDSESPATLSASARSVTILAALIHGEDRDAVLSPDWKPLHHVNDIKPLHPLIQEIALGSFRQQQPPAIQESGSVVKSPEASLWAFHNTESFEDAVLKAVNLGDDADTTGAICGQLAGAYWGKSGIPESLRSGLARMDMLEIALDGLLTQNNSP